jgi:hypothetical protein
MVCYKKASDITMAVQAITIGGCSWKFIQNAAFPSFHSAHYELIILGAF